MQVAITIDQLVSYTQSSGVSGGCLIGIDGFDDTGKTTLAFQLAERLDGIRVGLDSYVAKQTSAPIYAALLRTQHLKRDLCNLLSRFPFVVVDGVCLLEALESVSLSASLVVYVKKLSLQGLWHDGFHLEENYVAGEATGSWLADSLNRYHHARQPHVNASICYHWTRV